MARREHGDNGGVPDEVWRRFAEACRAPGGPRAPREPSARERAAGARVEPEPVEAVGELWRPAEARDAPAWRELDGRGRRRLVYRALAAAAAVVLFLLVVAGGPGSGPDGYETPGGTTVQQSEDAPAERPTTAEELPDAPGSG
ncbi:hypothetical protein [Streptomyces sp. NPDC057877]|uniref:hypothetical protein n=1 Tax=Streptomyces sp. NPDC057877 TaxID=3346269 RepID=UPI003698F152